MIVAHDLAALSRRRRPIALAAGFFDGVHRGHARVLDAARRQAAALGGKAWVLTFAAHPARVLAPAAAPRLLTGNRHKLRLLRQAGMDGCLLLPFTRARAHQDAADFGRALLAAAPALACILVGRGWRFGRGAAGDTALLRRLAREQDVQVITVPPVRYRGAPVSSTRVRDAVRRGRLAEAARMLGRPFDILGTVTPGRQAGRALGFPTANLDPHNEVLPPEGVYAVAARLGRRVIPGALSCGRRLTFDTGETRPTLEVHLLAINADLYGRDIEVALLQRLRNQRRYATPGALVRQIARDVDASRACFVRWQAAQAARTA